MELVKLMLRLARKHIILVELLEHRNTVLTDCAVGQSGGSSVTTHFS